MMLQVAIPTHFVIDFQCCMFVCPYSLLIESVVTFFMLCHMLYEQFELNPQLYSSHSPLMLLTCLAFDMPRPHLTPWCYQLAFLVMLYSCNKSRCFIMCSHYDGTSRAYAWKVCCKMGMIACQDNLVSPLKMAWFCTC